MKKFPPAWRSRAVAATEAARLLPGLAEHFFESGDRVTRPATSEEKLHEFRLESKRIRYTLELFEPLYGPSLRPLIAAVRKVQQVLGELNDCQASLELLANLPEPVDPAWIHAIELRRDRKRGEFSKLWATEFSAATLREDFLSRLAEPKQP